MSVSAVTGVTKTVTDVTFDIVKCMSVLNTIPSKGISTWYWSAALLAGVVITSFCVPLAPPSLKVKVPALAWPT